MFEVDEADLERVTAELHSQGKAEKLKSWKYLKSKCRTRIPPKEQLSDNLRQWWAEWGSATDKNGLCLFVDTAEEVFKNQLDLVEAGLLSGEDSASVHQAYMNLCAIVCQTLF